MCAGYKVVAAACGTNFSTRAVLTFRRARRYFAGADLVSVFVAGAEGAESLEVVVLELELESEPPEADESLDLPVDSPVAEPAVEPPDVSVVEPADEPAEVPDVAVLLEVALSVL